MASLLPVQSELENSVAVFSICQVVLVYHAPFDLLTLVYTSNLTAVWFLPELRL